jgi:hypothetical protein
MRRSEKIKECFEHIHEHWKEEYYKECRKEWELIQTFISKTPTNYQCFGCETYWTKLTFVNDADGICPNCDTWCQPFLCNPINIENVLKYIDPKFYPYIFSSVIYNEHSQKYIIVTKI